MVSNDKRQCPGLKSGSDLPPSLESCQGLKKVLWNKSEHALTKVKNCLMCMQMMKNNGKYRQSQNISSMMHEVENIIIVELIKMKNNYKSGKGERMYNMDGN